MCYNGKARKSLTFHKKWSKIMAKKSFLNRLIYSITEKPKHYVEVRNPPRTAWESLPAHRMHDRCSTTGGVRRIKYIVVHISRIKGKSLKTMDGKQCALVQTHTKPSMCERARDNMY